LQAAIRILATDSTDAPLTTAFATMMAEWEEHGKHCRSSHAQ
jgi:hypothetical protein